MKKNNVSIIIVLLLIVSVLLFIFKDNIFGNKNPGIQNNIFKTNVDELVKIFNDQTVDTDKYRSAIKIYSIINNSILGYGENYYTREIEPMISYKLSDNFLSIKDATFIVLDDAVLYFSINDGTSCAIKPLESNDYEIYSIKDNKEKCRIAYIYPDDLGLELYVADFDKNKVASGEVVNGGEVLSAKTNLLDIKAATYRWYRDGYFYKETESNTLVVEEDDAMYYVEVKPYGAEIFKTEEFHVITKKL